MNTSSPLSEMDVVSCLIIETQSSHGYDHKELKQDF